MRKRICLTNSKRKRSFRRLPSLLAEIQSSGRGYRRINDTRPPSYRGPNVSNYSPTNRAPISKNGP
ncbi:hypothetical protein TNCV_4788811 [Trichonephila clavipes]|nr:hypothetical protein TNCV_4788811 [Trichonephila clavipes]